MAQERQPVEPKRSTLQITRSEAETLIHKQIEKGQKFLALRIGDPEKVRYVRILSDDLDDSLEKTALRILWEDKRKLELRNYEWDIELDQALKEETKWSDYNIGLLKRMVDTDDLVNGYPPPFDYHHEGFDRCMEKFRRNVERGIYYLELVSNRLDLIPELPALAQLVKEQLVGSHPEIGRRVFVVHGHDPKAKQSVARCLEKLELKPIILHEKPSRGRTIIEKFEDYADVGFAVVLLTPDDTCIAKADMNKPKPRARPRARQNVVFELGFFVGRLGRQRVCALLKGDVEIPSDFAGVLWVPMDPQGAWRFELVREMKAAGLDVDPNKLL